MQTIYACTCGSTDLYRDAAIEINDSHQVHEYSSVSCGSCGYDGSHYIEVQLSEEEIADCNRSSGTGASRRSNWRAGRRYSCDAQPLGEKHEQPF